MSDFWLSPIFGFGLIRFALFVAVFLACAVEAVAALTIVLAMGMVRGWRSAGPGVLAALVVLALLVAVLGPALAIVPLGHCDCWSAACC